MALKNILFSFLILMICCGFSSSADVLFGGCQPENQTCAECYHNLRVSLLKSDINIRQLFTAFYPPKDDSPEFVNVTYCFNENCSKSKTWYWSQESSYLFLPLQTFEFLSLYFSKPMEYITQNLTLFLDEECYKQENNDTYYNNLFNLLTQRLKNFIQKASFDPSIDDNYFARAEEDGETFLGDHPPTGLYILFLYCAGYGTALIITISLLIVHCLSNKWFTKLREAAKTANATKSTQSKIFSVAATTFLVNVYTLVLSSIALAKRINDHGAINESYVNSLPYIVCSVDAVGVCWWLFFWIGSMIFSLCLHVNDKNEGIEYILLALSSLGPILTFIIHIPYITIAFLNDGTYATSILICYLITIFAVFGTLNSTYGACLSAFINAERGKKKSYCILNHLCVPHAIVIPILFLAGMIAAMLMIVPITKAFSDAPSRLQTFYQTAAVVVGVYFVYWKFYTNKPSIDSVISERQERFQIQAQLQREWNTLSKEERVKEFYAKFSDIIMNYTPFTGENQRLKVTNQLLQEVHCQLQIADQRLQAVRVQLQAANPNPANPAIQRLLEANGHLHNANQHLQTANQRLRAVIMLQATDQYEQLEVINQQLLRAANFQLEAAYQQLHAASQHQRVAIPGLVANQQLLIRHRTVANEQVVAANHQLQSANVMVRLQIGDNHENHGLEEANNELHTANEQLRTVNVQLAGIEVGGGGGGGCSCCSCWPT